MMATVSALPQDCWYTIAQFLPREDLRRLRAVNRSMHSVAIFEDARRAPLQHMFAESTLLECAPICRRKTAIPGASIDGTAYASCSDVFLDRTTQTPWFVAMLQTSGHGVWQRFELNASSHRFEPWALPHISASLSAALAGNKPKASRMVGADHLWVIAQHSQAHWALLHVLDAHRDEHLCSISLSPQTLMKAVPMHPEPDHGPMDLEYLPEIWDRPPAFSLLAANLVLSVKYPYLSLTLQEGWRQLDVALDYKQGRVLSVLPSSAWGENSSLSGFHLLDAQRSYLSFAEGTHQRILTWQRFHFGPPGVRPRADERQDGPDLQLSHGVGQNGLDTVYLRGCGLSGPRKDARAIYAVTVRPCGAAHVSWAPIVQGGRTEVKQVFGLMGSYVARAPDWRDWVAQSLGHPAPWAPLRPYPLQQLPTSIPGTRGTTTLSQEGEAVPRRVTYAQFLLTQNPKIAPFVVVRRHPVGAEGAHELVLLRLAAPTYSTVQRAVSSDASASSPF